MDKVRWREGTRRKLKAGKVLDEIQRIEAEHGVASPDAIVEEAAPKGAVLHPEFEWADGAAAHSWRKQQARRLVTDLVIVDVDSGKEHGPAFVSVQISEDNRGYASTLTVLSSEELRTNLLREARTALAGWRARYRQLRELAKVVDVIDSTLDE